MLLLLDFCGLTKDLREWWTTLSAKKQINDWSLTRTDCWTMPDYCRSRCWSAESRGQIVAQHRSILAVNCLENYLKSNASVSCNPLINEIFQLTHETRWNWSGSWHPEWRSESLAASLSSLAVALVDQLVFTHRVNAPKASLARLILRAWHFNEVAIQTEIVSNAEKKPR